VSKLAQPRVAADALKRAAERGRWALPMEMYMHKIPFSALLLLAAASLCACATEDGTKHTSSVSLAQNTENSAPATIRVAYFTRQPVIEMAQKHGFFADENLTVIEVKTAGSTLLFKNLRDGVWDIGLNVADNNLQFRLNPGNPLHMTFPAVIFARMDNGAGASLMTRPDIKTCADARGKTFAVDAPGSGYAYIGYQILRNKCGFEPNVDYPVVITGGTDKRYEDLIANQANSQMVLIHTGLPERAEAKGMTRFGTMLPDAVSAYSGVVATATRSWLDAHGDVAVRFLRAMKRGTDYVVDPANKAEVLAILPADGNAATAARIYEMFINEANGGLIRNLNLDRNGLLATAQLRQTWHGWDAPLDLTWVVSEQSGVYDMSYWRRAVKSHGED
jgi:ABC-type nitrate/sulfonate/bicarbonate transport system substrate-binding protein